MRRNHWIWLVLLLLVSAVALQASSESGLQIIYIEYANNADEIVVLFNATPFDIDLTGYRIWSYGGQEFVFQKTALNPQDPVIRAFDVVRVHSVYCGAFEDPRDFNWMNKDASCRQSAVWNDDGDQAKLFSPGSDIPISEYSYQD